MPTPHASGRSHYIPILKLMPGELKALEFITSMLRTRITPLLEVRPPKEVGNARAGTSTMETMDKVLKVNVYLHDLEDYAGMNEVYRGRFGPNPPVRTTIAAYGGIPGKSLVEIDCIAAL